MKSKKRISKKNKPLFEYDIKGVLSKDYIPCRGRGRKKQLLNMSKLQIEAEKMAKLEKNRLAAKECRVRKKQRINDLIEEKKQLEKIKIKQEQQLLKYEKHIKKQDIQIQDLEYYIKQQDSIITDLQTTGNKLLEENNFLRDFNL